MQSRLLGATGLEITPSRQVTPSRQAPVGNFFFEEPLPTPNRLSAQQVPGGLDGLKEALTAIGRCAARFPGAGPGGKAPGRLRSRPWISRGQNHKNSGLSAAWSLASVEPGPMTEKADGTRRRRPVHDDRHDLVLKSARDWRFNQDVGDDLARILANLTTDVERFDSMVVLQRKLLEKLDSDPALSNQAQIDREAERIRRDALEMAARARQALEQLARLAESTESPREG